MEEETDNRGRRRERRAGKERKGRGGKREVRIWSSFSWWKWRRRFLLFRIIVRKARRGHCVGEARVRRPVTA